MTRKTAAFLLSITAGAALAHSGVKNADVLARMDQMKEIGHNVRVLSNMARGKTAFDATQAAAAQAALKDHAAAIPEAFRNRASDPKSEARSLIWTDWEGFTSEAKAMEDAVARLDTRSRQTLSAGMPRLGRSCGSCHETYRMEK